MNMVKNLVLAGAVMVVPVVAQETTAVVSCKQDGTVVNLNAQAHKNVTQDRVRTMLAVMKDGKSAEEVQKAINVKMADAKKVYDKADKDIKVSTGNYNVWQEVTPEVIDQSGVRSPKSTVWHGSQQVMLEAPAGKAVLKLVGDLQDAGLAMQGMDYYLSREATDKLNDDLTNDALATIGARAQKIGKTLGLTHVSYEEVNTSEAGGGYAVPMMAMKSGPGMARDAAVAPVGEAGESDVSLNVSVKVRLTK